jgi:hypothetical protein
VKGFLIKVPEGMLDLWRQAAKRRKVPFDQLIREAVNKDLESEKQPDRRDGVS